MKRIEDERIRFYLKHRAQIEEWVKIREDWLNFAHEFHPSLLGDLRNEVRKRGIDVEISVHEAAIRLRRYDWPVAEEGPAIELGWHKKADRVFLVDHVWCGIWTENTYFEKLSQARERPETEDYRERDARWGYPMYRYLDPPSGNFWESDNLGEHGKSVIQAVLKAWCDLAPLVDEAVSQSSQ